MSKNKKEPRQSRPGEAVINAVIINGREATSTKGARAILKEITDHEYSRDAIYRLYLDGKIEGARTDIANFYYIDSLRRAGQELIVPEGKKRSGRKLEQKKIPQEVREQALALHDQGLSNRKIASRLNVSYQTVNNWLNKTNFS